MEVVDGAGGWYRVRLDEVDRRRAAGTVLERRHHVGEPAYDLTLGMALLKHPARLETFLEKAVETGVRTVVPLVTARTEKAQLKVSRAAHILVAAMKQCGRSRLVELASPMSLTAFLERDRAGVRLLCHEQAAPDRKITVALQRHPSERTLSILVGPEGGFSAEEVARGVSSGCEVVSLGPRRLRAETAGIVAATAVMLARS